MTATAPDAGMPDWQAPGVLHVIAENPESLQNGLDHAVHQIRETSAPEDPRGILITRRSRSLFTVEASTDVPYGTTLEKDRWHRDTTPASTCSGDEAVL